MALDYFLEQLSAQSEETQVMANDGNMNTTTQQSAQEAAPLNAAESNESQQSIAEEHVPGEMVNQTQSVIWIREARLASPLERVLAETGAVSLSAASAAASFSSMVCCIFNIFTISDLVISGDTDSV